MRETSWLSLSHKAMENQYLCVSFRSWSSRTSSLCFTVFTLSLLPKLLAWIRCLWRATELRLTWGFPLFLVFHVIHRHRNWNLPLDRCCSLHTPFKRMLDLAVTLAWSGGQKNWKTFGLWHCGEQLYTVVGEKKTLWDW